MEKIQEGEVFTTKTDLEAGTYSVCPHIITDKETGVQYIAVSTQNGVAITPRLEAGFNGAMIVKCEKQ